RSFCSRCGGRFEDDGTDDAVLHRPPGWRWSLMKRVLLVNPPFYRLLGSHYNANSLGIAYVAAVLNQHGHDAWLYNADFVNAKTYANLRTLFEGFYDYTRYFQDEDNEIWEEVVQRIVESLEECAEISVRL